MALEQIYTSKSDYYFLKGYGEIVIHKETESYYMNGSYYQNGNSSDFWTSSRANSSSDPTRVYQGNWKVYENVIGTNGSDLIKREFDKAKTLGIH
ncbi:hypothetical protein [Pleurocapsa sp. PCC 7319]|uniref:hypothetical protein n=1 Tax=Pleurocapsa sp. PCC 7319 TaxID=118161 RepID=UPI0003486424|nr:hypothetical protein [Pleurocapsa sp. PCC 7319]